MKRIRRLLLRLLMLDALLVGAAYLAKRMIPTYGDPDTDEFQFTSILDGTEFASRALALREGTMITALGGTKLDLTGATLAPGAKLNLTTLMGGLQVIVPEKWRLELDGRTMAGGRTVSVTPPEDLPEDAPTIAITANTVFAGIEITTHV